MHPVKSMNATSQESDPPLHSHGAISGHDSKTKQKKGVDSLEKLTKSIHDSGTAKQDVAMTRSSTIEASTAAKTQLQRIDEGAAYVKPERDRTLND